MKRLLSSTILVLFVAAGLALAPDASAGLGPGPFNDNFQSTRIVANGTYVPVVFDIDCDGDEDIIWYGPGSAADYLWTITGTDPLEYTSSRLSISGRDYRPQIFGPASTEGCTALLWNSPSGQDHVWYPKVLARGATPAAAPTQIDSFPVTIDGDYLTAAIGDRSSSELNSIDVLLYGVGDDPEQILHETSRGVFELVEAPPIPSGYDSITTVELGGSENARLDSVVLLDDEGDDVIYEQYRGAVPAIGSPTPRTLTNQRPSGSQLIGPLFFEALGGLSINYGPGTATDDLIEYSTDTDMVSAPGSIRGNYIVESGVTTIVFHKPGSGADYLWVFPTDVR